MKTMNDFVCVHCGKAFQAYRQTGRKYCSLACSNLGRGGPKAPNGSGCVGVHGYRYVRIGGKRKLEHRAVMESHLGRPLGRTEVVHHKDGNKLNNTISNLELKAGQAEHLLEHIKRFASDTHKECSRCETVKPRGEFPKRGKGGHNRDPHSAYCKLCQATKAAERAIANRGTCPGCGRVDVYLQSKGLCRTCYHRKWKARVKNG